MLCHFNMTLNEEQIRTPRVACNHCDPTYNKKERRNYITSQHKIEIRKNKEEEITIVMEHNSSDLHVAHPKRYSPPYFMKFHPFIMHLFSRSFNTIKLSLHLIPSYRPHYTRYHHISCYNDTSTTPIKH